jgi:hypothetical protein
LFKEIIMKKRFMLTAAGVAATGFGATVSGDTVNWTHELDRWAGEHSWQCMDASGNIVASMYISASSLQYAGDGITSLSIVSNTASSIFGTVTFNMDMAGGDYHVNMQDSWGDGWAWGTFVGGLYVSGAASGGASLPSGSTASFDFTVSGGPSDPCDDALSSPCAEDLDGDGAVAVSDVLIVIGSWGQMGDGTFRPAGDCAPLPNGDCYVDVADVLGVVGAWGADCAPPLVYGACCMADESCSDLTEDDCSAAAGTYRGDDTDCASTSCVAGKGDSCADAIPAYDGANAFDTTTNLPGADLPTCAEDAASFGWGEDSNPEYPDGVATNDVWFMWTATETDDFNVDTCELASFDTSLVVYGGCGGAGDQIACSGDGSNMSGCQEYYSSLTFAATAGATYYIRIGGWDPAEFGVGTLNINVVPPPLPGACCFSNDDCLDNLDDVDCGLFGGSFAGEGTSCGGGACDAPDNDECASAVVAVVGANSFDTSLMTPSTPEPDETMCEGTYLEWMGSQDAWFEFVPTADGLASFSLCDGASYDTSMVLYAGDCDTQVACNGDTSGESGCQAYYSAIYDWPVTGGTSYYIRIGGWQAAYGAGTLTIAASADIPSACCTGSGCEMLDIAGCAAANGSYLGSGSVCEDATCYAGCPADSVDEGAPCFEDGDDANSDINGGPLVDPAMYGSISAGVPICGTVSVYMNIDGAGPYRDMDMYLLDGLENGGVYTITVGTSGFDMLFGVLELNPAGAAAGLYGVAGAFWEIPGGIEGTVTTVDLPPLTGDQYMIGAFPASWDTSWTCDSGLNEYHITVD